MFLQALWLLLPTPVHALNSNQTTRRDVSLSNDFLVLLLQRAVSLSIFTIFHPTLFHFQFPGSESSPHFPTDLSGRPPTSSPQTTSWDLSSQNGDLWASSAEEQQRLQ